MRCVRCSVLFHTPRKVEMRSMKRLRRYFPLVALIVLLTPVMYVPVVAEGQPQPDPAGIATGDRTTAVDAAGNSFVVPEPDKSDPDYAAKKKAYDDFQAQLTREPLAAKVADVAGHVRIATNAAWT